MKNLSFNLFCFCGGFFLAAIVWAAPPRDYVSAVGSSTVYPFATLVAERVGKTTRFRAPLVASLGSGGGIRLFCRGLGPEHPDIALASREITPSEWESCRQQDVGDIVEVKFGYDGILIASAKGAPHLSLTPKDLYLALGKTVPDPDGDETLVPNPYKTWKTLNPRLPDIPIRIYGPPPTSGTRDVLAELAMVQGCRSFPWMVALEIRNPEIFRTYCQRIREDGVYVESGENDNLIVQKLQKDTTAVGIFGFNFYDQNYDRVQAAEINGVAPTWETIFERFYPLARPLYVYVKAAHIGWIPGLQAFLLELTDESAWGEDGYLADRGLIPLPREERELYASKVRALRRQVK